MEVDRVLVYEVNDPRRIESDIQQQRAKDDVDRYVNEEDAELAKILEPIWNHDNLKGVERHGGSFWLEIK